MDRNAKNNEMLRQRMTDLLHDARALRALIEEARQKDDARGERWRPVVEHISKPEDPAD